MKFGVPKCLHGDFQFYKNTCQFFRCNFRKKVSNLNDFSPISLQIPHTHGHYFMIPIASSRFFSKHFDCAVKLTGDSSMDGCDVYG